MRKQRQKPGSHVLQVDPCDVMIGLTGPFRGKVCIRDWKIGRFRLATPLEVYLGKLSHPRVKRMIEAAATIDWSNGGAR